MELALMTISAIFCARSSASDDLPLAVGPAISTTSAPPRIAVSIASLIVPGCPRL